MLVKQPPGEEDGDDGIEIDPVGSHNSTQLMNDPIPNEEADHGGYDAQEKQVP